MDANNRKVNELFNATDKNKTYRIPPYQREYVWKIKDWDFFINDIDSSEIDNGESHFLGSIITINDKENKCIDIIDGQQRMTTISLVLTAINHVAINREDSTDLKKKFRNMITYSSDSVAIDETIPRLIPSLQKNDKENYLALLVKNNLITDCSHEIDENSNIIKAFNYFVEILEEFSNEKLLTFYDKLNATVLIEISVSDYNSANRLFETLNNRGQELTPMDLIKNIIFSKVKENTIESSMEKWNKLIKYLDKATIQERFLRQFYNAFSFKKEINVLNKKKISASNIIDTFQKILEKNDAKDIFNDIFEKSKIYGIFEGTFPLNKLEFVDFNNHNIKLLEYNLFELKKIGTAPAYVYLLFLINENIESGNISASDIIEIITIIKKYFIRRTLTGVPGTNALDDIFINLIEETISYLNGDIPEYSLPDIVIGVLQNNNKYATDELVIQELNGDIYEEHKDILKMLLVMYENSQVGEKEHTKDLWENVNNNRGKIIEYYTIEHILPQTIDKEKTWIKMLSDNEEKSKELHEQHINKLGNLTLTAYNSNLGNKSFEVKKNKKDEDGKYIGYLSERNLKLNDDIKNEPKWQVGNINNRTTKIATILLDLLKIEASPYKKDKEKKINKRATLPRMSELFKHNLLKKGDNIYIKNHPNSNAEIIDDKYVLYKNEKMSFNKWGQGITGWKTIQIYVHAYLEKTNLSLHELRGEIK